MEMMYIAHKHWRTQVARAMSLILSTVIETEHVEQVLGAIWQDGQHTQGRQTLALQGLHHDTGRCLVIRHLDWTVHML